MVGGNFHFSLAEWEFTKLKGKSQPFGSPA